MSSYKNNFDGTSQLFKNFVIFKIMSYNGTDLFTNTSRSPIASSLYLSIATLSLIYYTPL